MGLQLQGLVEDVQQAHRSALIALGLGAAAVVLALLIRSGYVTFLLASIGRRTPDAAEVRARLAFAERQQEGRLRAHAGMDADQVERRRQGWARRVTRWRADVAYFERWPLGRREGAVLVWAGMRGAITVAAALTLPAGTDSASSAERSLLVLVAYCAASLSLLVQGATLGWVVRTLDLQVGSEDEDREEQTDLRDLMSHAALELVDDPGLTRADGGAYDPRAIDVVRSGFRSRTREALDEDSEELAAQLLELRLRAIAAQRSVLIAARDAGTFNSRALTVALEVLDADQVSAELRAGDTEDA
jgi:CPA1 family monovalent cation:H+ antiporter